MKKKIYKYYTQFKFKGLVSFTENYFLKINNETKFKKKDIDSEIETLKKLFMLLKDRQVPDYSLIFCLCLKISIML